MVCITIRFSSLDDITDVNSIQEMMPLVLVSLKTVDTPKGNQVFDINKQCEKQISSGIVENI
jgi:hypothetical protein